MKGYYAIVKRAHGRGYRVHFPDLPGCECAGDTVEDAFGEAQRHLRRYAERAAQRGDDLPAPKPASNLPVVAERLSGVAAACLSAPQA